ncbi:MAG TPA: hypothetical protein VIB00_06995 [Pyrinomonadaceae bacterium]
MQNCNGTRHTVEKPDAPPTHPYDPLDPDQPNDPLPIPPDPESPPPIPGREPHTDQPVGDPPNNEPTRLASK